METAKNRSLDDFIQDLGSNSPAPGGGGASALIGAAGVALAGMVASLTTGKKKYAAYQEDIERILDESTVLTNRMLELIDEDAENFAPLAGAYRLPNGTDEEKARRNQAIEEGSRQAITAPLAMIDTAVDATGLLEELLEKGSVLAVSDVGVGAAALDAAVHGAWLNVVINTSGYADRDWAIEIHQSYQPKVHESHERLETLINAVYDRLEQA